MAQIIWSQDKFTKGELSPLMYARVTVQAYYDSLKQAKNIVTLPQGAAGKRFGTLYLNEITGVTDKDEIFFETFQYLNECVYLVVFKPDEIDIFLEGTLVANVTSTGIFADDLETMDYTVIENRFRVTTDRFRPQDLERSANAPTSISSIDTGTNIVTHSGSYTTDIVLPVQFTTGSSLPTAVPAIRLDKTYFIKTLSATTFKVYTTAPNAKAGINELNFSSAGVSNNVVVLNDWELKDTEFRNIPAFDFEANYDAINFTPGAATGSDITLTASSAIFSSAFEGGVFAGNGGIGRIVSVTSTTVAKIDIVQDFNAVAAISGRISFLGEPAWSTDRGWPKKCSSFQNRAIFANTDSLPNGLWLSVINDFDDFDDIETDDDNAISWFPTSDSVNYIRFIVPYRSLTIHTNSGIYSTPLAIEQAITPSNFSLSLQDSTPADVLQPKGIDNQIIIISGNDVHSMLWDGFNNAYTSNIVSVANEHLIRDPQDMAPYVDLNRAGSRYVFIVNDDGTLAVYQTLISEEVSGFTDAELEQPYGNAYFRKAASNFDGRAWFVTEREIAEVGSSTTISAVSDTTVTATGTNFDTDNVTAVKFTTTGTLPDTTPQIVEDQYYWVKGIDADNFQTYLTISDAEDETNAIEFADIGSGTNQVEAWPLSTKFYIEELSYDMYVDCAHKYDSSATSTLTGLSRFNAQDVLMQGDGYGFEGIVENGEFEVSAHGESVDVSQAQLGFGISVSMTPLPLALSISGSQKSTNLVFPKHIRSVSLIFADTIGGTVQGSKNAVPISLKTFGEVSIGAPPSQGSGVFEIGLTQGWNDFRYDSFTISHYEPFDIKLLGIFYKVDA